MPPSAKETRMTWMDASALESVSLDSMLSYCDFKQYGVSLEFNMESEKGVWVALINSRSGWFREGRSAIPREAVRDALSEILYGDVTKAKP
jgi:hypothetical protein